MLKVHYKKIIHIDNPFIEHLPENQAVVKDELLEKIKSIYSDTLGENQEVEKPKENTKENTRENTESKKETYRNSARNKMVDQIIFSSQVFPNAMKQTFLSSQQSTDLKKKNNFKCFSFKVKTNRIFKKEENKPYRLKYNKERKFFEISDEYLTNYINIENIIATYLNIKGVITDNDGYYILIKKIFFIGDMLNENSEIFNNYLFELMEMLENFDIFEYKPYTDDLIYISELITNLYQIIFRKIKNLRDLRLSNQLIVSSTTSYVKFKDDIKKYEEQKRLRSTTAVTTTVVTNEATSESTTQNNNYEKEEENNNSDTNTQDSNQTSKESKEDQQDYPSSDETETEKKETEKQEEKPIQEEVKIPEPKPSDKEDLEKSKVEKKAENPEKPISELEDLKPKTPEKKVSEQIVYSESLSSAPSSENSSESTDTEIIKPQGTSVPNLSSESSYFSSTENY